MSRPSQNPIFSKDEKNILTRWSKSKTEEHRLVVRAKIALMSADGMSDAEKAKVLSLNPNTVRTWRCRFLSGSVDGFKALPRRRFTTGHRQ